MNKKQVDTFETLNAQLKALYDEMQTLVKKSPNDGINKFKLHLINAVLRDVNSFLSESRKPIADFSEFNENDLPSNSDVLIVLSQYLSCLEKIRADNIVPDTYNDGEWYWVINGKTSDIRTAPPKKLAQ
jgi:hypothetical protein